jgi:hypothetical protein
MRLVVDEDCLIYDFLFSPVARQQSAQIEHGAYAE